MKRENLIKDALNENKRSLKVMEKHGQTETNDYMIIKGWVEALEFVLSDIAISPITRRALDQIAYYYQRMHFLHKISGGYSYFEVVDVDLPYDNDYLVDIFFGVQDDCRDDKSVIRIAVAKKDIEEWGKSDQTELVKFTILE